MEQPCRRGQKSVGAFESIFITSYSFVVQLYRASFQFSHTHLFILNVTDFNPPWPPARGCLFTLMLSRTCGVIFFNELLACTSDC
jgi:hypothetical protein